MNLEEYPAFRLGRRSRRPELRYARTRSDADGRTLEHLWVVRGAEGLGLPGPFEQDLYVALLVLFTEQGLPSDGRIRFTRNRLAQVMGCSNSGRGYELLEQGLARLAGATIHTEHAFYRPSPIGGDGERAGPAERLSLDFHILEEVRVYERGTLLRAVPAETMGRDEADLPAPARRRGEHARPLELSVARLGLPLVQSYERRYTKGLDATFYFALTRPLAKRLYRYLDKVRHGRGSFEIGVRGLADVLGLEYRYPSDIKDGLAEAHAELQSAGYIASAGYASLAGGPSAGEKVVYSFHTTFDSRPRRRAGAGAAKGQGSDDPVQSGRTKDEGRRTKDEPGAGLGLGLGARPQVREQVREQGAGEPAAGVSSVQEKAGLQRELESFGMTASRAATLVAAHPAEHVAARIEYVRVLVRRTTGGAGSVLKNPAGFLARAIEESYTLPAAALSAASHPELKTVAHLEHLEPPCATPPSPLAPPPSVPGMGDQPAAGEAPSGSAAPLAPVAPVAPTATGSEWGPWEHLAMALKERLSAGTYAAWILPAHPYLDLSATVQAVASPPEKGQTVTLVVPNAFAIERWRRSPIAPALDEAAAALGINVVLRLAAGS